MPLEPKEKHTVEELRSVFRYDKDSGNLFWIDRPRKSRVLPGSIAGCKKADGYIRVQYLGGMLQAHRVAWAIFYGSWPNGFIDHKNRNRSDNRIENLRLATHAENIRNTTVRSHNKLGLKGVEQKHDRFAARIVVDGKRIRLGSFATKEEAALAYLEAAKKFHGEFACAEGRNHA